MDWDSIFNRCESGSASTPWSTPGGHRAQPALRVHRPAQLRPGRRSWPSVPTASASWSLASACRSGRRPRGLVACVVLALLLGVPTLRLRADYLAIVTIAAGEIIRLVFSGRPSSARSPAGPTASTGSPSTSRTLNPLRAPRPVRVVWVINLASAATSCGCMHRRLGPSRCASLLVWLLMRSPWGRVLKAIREDEDAVRASARTSTPTRCRPDPRRRHRHLRRHRSSPSRPGGAARQLRHAAHVLRLHGA